MNARDPTPADAASHLAWLRTRFALERTFMAWARTAVGMIGFGFTIVEFFARLSSMSDVAPAKSHFVPYILGVILVGTGIASLAISFAQHLRSLDHLSSDFAQIADRSRSSTPAWVVTIAIELAGIVALGSIIVRAIL